MEWRAIPDYAGYEINRSGVIRKVSSGYVMCGSGKYTQLSINGRQVRARRSDLLAAAFASKDAVEQSPAPAFVPVDTPVPAPDVTPASTPVPDHDPKAAAFASKEAVEQFPAPASVPVVDTPAPATDVTPASTPVPDIAPATPAPASTHGPTRDPEKEALRADLDAARRSLELARRVNGHQMALIDELRTIISKLEVGVPKQQRGRKRKAPADATDYLPATGNVDARYFEDEY
jgi:hypothetical protein